MSCQRSFKIQTHGRGMINVTDHIAKIIAEEKISIGLCNVFLHHTSASIILCENADPDVQFDLEVFMQRLVPDEDSLYKHTAEGPDDMPAHVRTMLTQNSLTIPITDNQLNLGTWQGIFLWEHRLQKHERKITVTLI